MYKNILVNNLEEGVRVLNAAFNNYNCYFKVYPPKAEKSRCTVKSINKITGKSKNAMQFNLKSGNKEVINGMAAKIEYFSNIEDRLALKQQLYNHFQQKEAGVKKTSLNYPYLGMDPTGGFVGFRLQGDINPYIIYECLHNYIKKNWREI